MSVVGVFERWFASLSPVERALALSTADAVPEWMSGSLTDAGVVLIPADIPARSVLLMPTQLREFLEGKSHAHARTGMAGPASARQHFDDLVDVALGAVTALAAAMVEAADGVSITLERYGRLMTVAATNDEVLTMDRHQYETGEGPCLDAKATGSSLYVHSVEDDTRWPSFTPLALDQGIRAIASFPLRAGDQPKGALNMYSKRERAFQAPDQQQLATLFAEQASAVLTAAEPEPSAAVSQQEFARASQSRRTIHRCEGMIMARLEVSADSAMAFVRNAARVAGVTVLEYATIIVDSADGATSTA